MVDFIRKMVSLLNEMMISSPRLRRGEREHTAVDTMLLPAERISSVYTWHYRKSSIVIL